MEVLVAAVASKIGRDRKWPQWLEILNPSVFIWCIPKLFVELAVADICAIQGLEWDEFRRVGREVGSMLFYSANGIGHRFQLVRCPCERLDNPPRSCKGVHEFIDATTFGVRLRCTTGKDNITNRVDLGVPST